MSFDDKYEILAELRNDGIKTVVAREKATGQAVEAHLFLAGRTAENTGILDKIQRLTPDHAQFVLEVGDHEGTPYVVSHLLPDRRGLREWLGGIPDAPPASGPSALSNLEKGATLPPFQAYDPSKGATLPPFQAPSAAEVEKGATLPSFRAPSLADVEKGATLPPFQAPSLQNLDKGATLPPFQAYDPSKGATLPPFQTPSLPERGETLPPFRAFNPSPPPAAGLPVDPAPAKRGADEDFLRLFQVPERAKGGLSTSSVPATPPPSFAPPPAPLPVKSGEPGEFTRLFQSSELKPPPAAAAAMPASESPTEELPLPSFAPPGSSAEAPKPADAGPGEFTRMFNAQSAAPPAAAPAPPAAAPETARGACDGSAEAR
jgi:hypothetical protein